MIAESRLTPGHFSDPAILEQEQQSIFRNTWQFFCLASDLAQHNDFVTDTIGGIPVVVQNIRGTLHAFHNVCSHRYSAIQTAKSGNRGLFCPYHGWTYDAEGVPAGIPHNNAYFPIEPARSRELALRRFGLATLGGLVFVSIAAGESLDAQLGQWQPLLAAIGGSMDDVYFTTCVPADCNWKLVVYNAFDDIHAQFVHPAASLDTRDFVRAGWVAHAYDPNAEDVTKNYSRRHAEFTVHMTPEGVRRNDEALRPHIPTPDYAFEHYLHLFIYPNLIITSMQGYCYNIVRYRPVSAGRSEMDYWLVPARPGGGQPSTVTPAFLYNSARAGMRIFNEDVAAVEAAQPGMKSVCNPGVLGKREDKIASFEAAYLDSIRAGVPVDGRGCVT